MREDWLRIVTADDAELEPSTEHAIRTARALVGVPLDGGFQIELHAGNIDLEIVIGRGGLVENVSVRSRDE